jgi:hypothetical protein
MSESIWFWKRIIDEASNIAQLETTFRDRAMTWYIKYKATVPMRQPRSLTELKINLLREF